MNNPINALKTKELKQVAANFGISKVKNSQHENHWIKEIPLAIDSSVEAWLHSVSKDSDVFLLSISVEARLALWHRCKKHFHSILEEFYPVFELRIAKAFWASLKITIPFNP